METLPEHKQADSFLMSKKKPDWESLMSWGLDSGLGYLKIFVLCCQRCFFLFFTTITPSNLLRQTRTHPRSRSTPRRCGATGWWRHRCPHARVWPPAPAAPPPSAAECLKRRTGDTVTLVTRTAWGTLELKLKFSDWTWCFPTFSDGFQQDAARVADGRKTGWVVSLGGRRQGHGSCRGEGRHRRGA